MCDIIMVKVVYIPLPNRITQSKVKNALRISAVADVCAWLGPGVESTAGWVPCKQKHKQ